VVSIEDNEYGDESDGGKLFVQVHTFISCSKLSRVLIVLLRPPELDIVVHCCVQFLYCIDTFWCVSNNSCQKHSLFT
jgi:hypothetical protein